MVDTAKRIPQCLNHFSTSVAGSGILFPDCVHGRSRMLLKLACWFTRKRVRGLKVTEELFSEIIELGILFS
jgi:hypothetical protein